MPSKPTIIFCENHFDPSSLLVAQEFLTTISGTQYYPSSIYLETPTHKPLSDFLPEILTSAEKYQQHLNSADRDTCLQFSLDRIKIARGRTNLTMLNFLQSLSCEMNVKGIDIDYPSLASYTTDITTLSPIREKHMALMLATNEPGIAIRIGAAHAAGIYKELVASQIWSEEEIKQRFIFVYTYSEDLPESDLLESELNECNFDNVIFLEYKNRKTLIDFFPDAMKRVKDSYNPPNPEKLEQARIWLQEMSKLETLTCDLKLDLNEIMKDRMDLSTQNITRLYQSLLLAHSIPMDLNCSTEETDMPLSLSDKFNKISFFSFDINILHQSYSARKKAPKLLQQFAQIYQQSETQQQLIEFLSAHFLAIAHPNIGSTSERLNLLVIYNQIASACIQTLFNPAPIQSPAHHSAASTSGSTSNFIGSL